MSKYLFIRALISVLLLFYIVIPSVKILIHSEGIYEYKLKNIESYQPKKAIVKKVELVHSEIEHINYDKDVFKHLYLYTLKNVTNNHIDTLYEKVKKNTFFFSQLKPSYHINDSILFYKNDTENITEFEYMFMIKYKDKKPILWFSWALLIISLGFMFILLKPLILLKR